MAKLSHNVVANFIGQAWTALIGALFVPVYIHLIGMEAYGLIGVYVSLQALLYVFDMGLSSTLNRELARLGQTQDETGVAHDLVRTLEWLFWPLSMTTAVVVLLASHPIARHWLQPVAFTPERVAHAVALMGLAISAQWPASFYAGGLAGLERQVPLNFINMVFATLRWVVVIPLLARISATIEFYLWWQVMVSLVHTITMRWMLLRSLPSPQRPPRFQCDYLLAVRGFALGMFGIALLSFVLVQIDRLVLSRLLPLDQFGHYVLVATVAAVLSRLFNPFFAVLYPRYSVMVANGNHEALVVLYHRSNQLLAVLVASVAATLAFFAADALRLWTHDPALARESAPLLAVLVTGVALNGLMNLPYALQLAHGWTRLSLHVNGVAVCLMVPLVWWLARHFGAMGAAAAWVGLNLAYLSIGIPLMHRRLLRGEMARWYIRDILPPLSIAALAAATMRQLVPPIPDNPAGLALLAVSALVVLVVVAASSPEVRAVLRERISRS